ncbi:hypothetical protein U879_10090 [Defluviimonas sp. 20V17]|uniref:Glycosyltransferase involved in LPS biosynthesis, GR25 family n=1 Tax=Allgaiera indica TaxID=765699 RepID=A0AAN4UNQ4_9RHOB|nr:glycosyltransferase family 25 protein [Allgaiera indica]KDB03819.1 hypothetical protein U879_10090 [Defluviimonas sp. 20V17]GHD98571.1 hypothetical protein GCM10008024_02620 [Allgaiera indica]SDW10700.1 Glycosyltransferase involved in LPS biosynthesis, GR25 family [Allgaiera indica]
MTMTRGGTGTEAGTAPGAVDIYKIGARPLSADERDMGVRPMAPVIGAELPTLAYFTHILGNFRDTGELLAPAEVGCALSHLSVYEEIVRSGRAAIILEEDISPRRDQLVAALDFAAQTRLPFVHLGWHPQARRGVYFLGRHDARASAILVDPARHFFGAFAYYLSPAAARELLAFQTETLRKADYWSLFFDSASFAPYFRPFFTHPEARGALDGQRQRAARWKPRATSRSLGRFLRARARLRWRKWFRGYRPVDAAYVARCFPQDLR